MKKSKKKTIAAVIVIAVIIVLIAAAVISVLAIRSFLISKSEARDIALNDAGLEMPDVSALRTRLDFDDGRFQYEVDFYCNGAEYEYKIQAKDGDIIERDIDGNRTDAPVKQDSHTDEQAVTSQNNSLADARTISAEEARAAALADAALSESDVSFTETKLDTNGLVKVYDIEFYSSDTKYEYEINASDASVYEKSAEPLLGQSGTEITASDDSLISADRAREIVLNHAGLSLSDVRFTKTELERDSKRTEYEIEFFYGATEYDYEIDAVSGDIIKYDTDNN